MTWWKVSTLGRTTTSFRGTPSSSISQPFPCAPFAASAKVPGSRAVAKRGTLHWAGAADNLNVVRLGKMKQFKIEDPSECRRNSLKFTALLKRGRGHHAGAVQVDFVDGIDSEGTEKRERSRIDFQKPLNVRPVHTKSRYPICSVWGGSSVIESTKPMVISSTDPLARSRRVFT